MDAVAAFVRAVGVGSEADLVALARTGVEGVIVGRALYENRLDLSVLSHEAPSSEAPASLI